MILSIGGRRGQVESRKEIGNSWEQSPRGGGKGWVKRVGEGQPHTGLRTISLRFRLMGKEGSLRKTLNKDSRGRLITKRAVR